MAEAIQADVLARMIRSEEGQQFKVVTSSDEAWDPNGSAGHALVCKINRGRGFEVAISVRNDFGTMFYIGPFELEQCPSDKKLLMFRCDEMFFVERSVGLN